MIDSSPRVHCQGPSPNRCPVLVSSSAAHGNDLLRCNATNRPGWEIDAQLPQIVHRFPLQKPPRSAVESAP